MLIIPDTNIVFIHIPKTAGQSVRDAFGMKLDGRGAHSIASERDIEYIAGDYIRFCVVRDPVARFQSAYAYNVALYDRNPTGIREYMRANGLNEDINAFVRHFMDKGSELVTSSDHFRQQMYYLRRTHPHIILRQERLDDHIEIIRALAPKQWKGLKTRNAASERGAEPFNKELEPECESFVRKTYAPDFKFLGY